VPLTLHLLLVAVLLQAFIGAAFALSQPDIAEALDRPLLSGRGRDAHVEAVQRALSQTVPLALVAVVVSGVLARPALSVLLPNLTGDWVDPSNVVRGVFGAVWVFGISLTAALVSITFGLRSRLGQVRSARW
jgi:hypothetical protein